MEQVNIYFGVAYVDGKPMCKKREGIAEADRDWFLLVNKSVIQIKIDFTVIILTFQALS